MCRWLCGAAQTKLKLGGAGVVVHPHLEPVLAGALFEGPVQARQSAARHCVDDGGGGDDIAVGHVWPRQRLVRLAFADSTPRLLAPKCATAVLTHGAIVRVRACGGRCWISNAQNRITYYFGPLFVLITIIFFLFCKCVHDDCMWFQRRVTNAPPRVRCCRTMCTVYAVHARTQALHRVPTETSELRSAGRLRCVARCAEGG